MSRRNRMKRSGTRKTALERPVYQNMALNARMARNSQLTNIYNRVLADICMSRFKWSGLPPTVSNRFIEWTLLTSGLSIFYDNSKYGFLSLRGTPAGQLNMYEDPVRYQVYGNLFINELVLAKDCVPIWCNRVRRPDMDVVDYFSSRLANLNMTIDENIRTQKHPTIIAADESEVFSLQNAYAEVSEGQPVVWGFPGTFSPSALKERMFTLDLGVHPDTILKQQDTKARIWNEAMTILGIHNVNTDKRERMVTDEVNANNDQVDAVKRSALESRQDACVLINKKYDLNISVEWNETVGGEFANYSLSGEGAGS